jgi:hypothetical protein
MFLAQYNEEEQFYLYDSLILGSKLNAKKKRLHIEAIPTRNLPKSSVNHVIRQISRSAEKRRKNRTERYERRRSRRFVVNF